jgi:phosphatidylglycerophosphate synthase
MLSPQEIREAAQAGKDRDPAWYRIHRRISIHITARLVQTRVTLNQISGLMLGLGALGAALNASSSLPVNALGWACLYGSFLLDKVDGEVARLRGQQSVIGILLDRFHHRLVEPLLFFAVGWRAFSAMHAPLPLLAALATMLAANIVEETQQLPPFIAAKHARETRTWPVSGRAPSERWERAAAWMRPLKTFRMFITVLPLVAGAELIEAFTHRPATTWLLVTSAVALWVYVLFQSGYYVAGRLEADIDTLTRELPTLPGSEPGPADAPGHDVQPEDQAGSSPPEVLEAAAAETPILWPLPPRARRSVTVAVEHADAERARARSAAEGPTSGGEPWHPDCTT